MEDQIQKLSNEANSILEAERASSPRPVLERCPKCHLAYVEDSNGVCVTDHVFEPNQQCSGLTCEICGNNKEWHDQRDEVLRRRRSLMPDYDRKLKEWLS